MHASAQASEQAGEHACEQAEMQDNASMILEICKITEKNI
jgi:hypothetical protein